ncbi:MAG: phosphate acyltransferase PlsX [Anaerolineae bacterium]|nr:phosphate acyltransferase PlsX [Anaerolineae bacterium]
MRIVLDAMGGDHAPEVAVEGGVMAAREYGIEVVLVGPQEVVEAELAKHDTAGLSLPVVHASQVIEMTDEPSMAARKKKDSSMVVGMNLVKSGEADAFTTAGNSGGALAAALFHLGRIKGIKRPALSTVFPTRKGLCFISDVGANTDCKPIYLLQFGIMGSAYAERVLGIPNPRVGIVSTGEEEGKGSILVKEAFKLLKESDLNFIGNVEGKDIPAGLADVVVTDGFSGNVAIKLAEGVAALLMEVMEEEIRKRPTAVLGALLARSALREVKSRLDYSEYGGAPLLGVDGVVIVGHGRSNAKAIKNMVRVGKEAAEKGMLEVIKEGIAGSV